MADKKDDAIVKEIETGTTPPEKLEGTGISVEVLRHVLPNPDADKTADEQASLDKNILWKVDQNLIPWLCLIYLLCFLDRTNIGNARLAGMEKDLHMKGHDYNTSLTIFFISYAGAEPFTNLLLKRITPRVFFTSVVLLWGFCMLCMGLVTSYKGLLVARFFLGVTEAGLFPGVQYYLSCWYRRSELGLRLSIFFANAALAGSFGGLLAAAIAKMDGLGNKAGWAWIFIIEGLATMLVGAASWIFVHNWPENASFLSQEERLRVQYRLQKDELSKFATEYDKRHVMEALKDWKTWAYCVAEMGNFMPLYAFSLFLPTIVAGMGYKGTHAQLLTVPPYAGAAVMTVFIGWLADRSRQRGICNMTMDCFAIVGFSMLLASKNPHVQYAGTFLGAVGIYPTIPNNLSWAANNFEGSYKRGVALGIICGWGNLNGIVSSNIYITSEKPGYHTGHATVLAYMIVCQLGATAFLRMKLASENRKRAAIDREAWLAGKTQDEIEVAGDRHPDFRYTL